MDVTTESMPDEPEIRASFEDHVVGARHLRRFKELFSLTQPELPAAAHFATSDPDLAQALADALTEFQRELDLETHEFRDLLAVRAFGALKGVVRGALQYLARPDYWGKLSWNRSQIIERRALFAIVETFAQGAQSAPGGK